MAGTRGERNTKRVSFMVHLKQEQFKKLEQMAKKDGLPVNYLVEKAVDGYLEEAAKMRCPKCQSRRITWTLLESGESEALCGICMHRWVDAASGVELRGYQSTEE